MIIDYHHRIAAALFHITILFILKVIRQYVSLNPGAGKRVRGYILLNLWSPRPHCGWHPFSFAGLRLVHLPSPSRSHVLSWAFNKRYPKQRLTPANE